VFAGTELDGYFVVFVEKYIVLFTFCSFCFLSSTAFCERSPNGTA
jgi:hypothetical protein